MAAGLGFKTFLTGDVLTAADTNGYLMQGVLVFATAAARDSAITSPQEGQFAFLKDTNTTTYYTGSAWTDLVVASSPAYVGAIVYGAVNLSYGSTNTAVSDLGTELIDTNGFHTGTQSRMTIPTGYNGKYRMELNITFAANDPTVRIFAYKNGSAITEGLVNGTLSALAYTAASLNAFTVGLVVTGVATDYFEFFIVNGSASKLVDKARYSFTYLGA
jgi:hypothetical protein